MPAADMPQICDYEGSDYRTRFWEGRGRDYEDRVERIAIRRLLPARGERIVEVGAGFGRLAPLYVGYRQIVLFDYSRSQLEFAREQYGDDGFLYVAGNVYEMPFAPGVFDSVIMVRVIHHMQDAKAALAAIRSIMKQGGNLVLEFANKQNLKAIVRWFLRRQDWNPFDLAPVEFVELNYDFHPRYIRQTLSGSGFSPGRTLTVSHLRVEIIKRLIPTAVLVALDSLFQLTGNLWQLTPSVFLRSAAIGTTPTASVDAFWRCPSCSSLELEEGMEGLTCAECGLQYLKRNGVYDFKEPVKPSLR